MTTYKGINGTAVQNYAGDPDNPITGQLWYDSNASEFKYQEQAVGAAWATANSLNTARNNITGATSGTQTASLAYGGFVPPHTGATESYNGTSWTELADLNTARNNAGGAGTQTSALCFGGYTGSDSALNESWNGTSWTELADLNTARAGLSGAGADNTLALAFGGESAPTAAHTETESWNGTSWTELNDLNSARRGLSGSGIQAAALGFGGGPPYVASTETWNGTSWSQTDELNTARATLGSAGSQAAALGFGGETSGGNVSATEEFDDPTLTNRVIS
jgi:hypothetical protein